MSKLPKWTERSDIKWRPVSEKPGNTGLLMFTNKEQDIAGPFFEDEFDWDNLDPEYVAWAWVCWDKT